MDSFRHNIDALCDPNDRGQGFLIRTVLGLVHRNGPRLFVRKYLVRSRLAAGIRLLREGLLRSYDPSGQLNYQAVQDAIRRCLSAIDAGNLSSIEEFARRALDTQLNAVVPAPDAPIAAERWVGEAFNDTAKILLKALAAESRANTQAQSLFSKFFKERVDSWRRAWGYSSARIPPPTRQNPAPRDLLQHSLKIHAREMLYQLVSDSSSVSTQAIGQDPQDREAVRQVLAALETIARQADTLCRQHGGTNA